MCPHLWTAGGDLAAVSKRYVKRLNGDAKAAAPFSDSPPPLGWKLLDITSSKHLHVGISSSSQCDNRFDDSLR